MNVEGIDKLQSITFDEKGQGYARIHKVNGGEVPITVMESVQLGVKEFLLVRNPIGRKEKRRHPYLVRVEDSELADYLAKHSITPTELG